MEPSAAKQPKKILVFPCGSEIGLEIHRALSFSTHVTLIGASSTPCNHGKFVYHNYIEGLPFVEAPDFIEALNTLIQEHRVDFIMPAHDSVVLKLARNAEQLACTLIGSPLETCETCRSKRLTYEHLASTLRTPAMYAQNDPNLPFPVFLKPDVGQGSHGVLLAQTQKELDIFLERDPSLLILEYLPGEEFTIDCFTDRHGLLLFSGARQRIRTMNGISVNTSPVDTTEFRPMAETLNTHLRFRGAWFFQAKRAVSGEPVLMEAAPRVSGAMGLFRNLGVNLPLMSVFDRMERDVEVLYNTFDLEMDRALINRFRLGFTYRRVYIDLDDTLLIDDKVHPPTIAFIYQCHNKGIKVHLVTRHIGNVTDTLARYRLTGLFDTVTPLDTLTCKSQHMKPQDAIFIDDSFAERKKVHEALGIPVFAVDALECLLDWRG